MASQWDQRALSRSDSRVQHHYDSNGRESHMSHYVDARATMDDHDHDGLEYDHDDSESSVISEELEDDMGMASETEEGSDSGGQTPMTERAALELDLDEEDPQLYTASSGRDTSLSDQPMDDDEEEEEDDDEAFSTSDDDPSEGSSSSSNGKETPVDMNAVSIMEKRLSSEGSQTPDPDQSRDLEAAAEDQPEWKPSKEFILAFSALSVISLGAAFDATSLSVAIPTISAHLGGTALQAFWSGTSFLLASTVLQPTVAGLSNIFGRKNLIYITLTFFLAGSIVSALANNYMVLITGRTIQGVGGGGLLAMTEVIITDLVPLHARGTWFSVLSAVWSVGTVIGPLLGAGFAQNVDWRWIFWINLPIIACSGIFVILFLNQAPIPGNMKKKLAQFDWGGSLIFTASATSFLFGITTGGVQYPWSSWNVLVSILVGLAGIILFGFWEVKVAKNPMISKGIFNNWDMIVNYIMTVFHGAILWSIVFFLLLYYQAVKLYTPVISAVAALPETLTVAPAGIVVGLVVMMTGRYRWSIWIGWALTTLGSGLLVLLMPKTSIAGWIWLNIPVGVGTGMLFPAMALSIQAACKPALNGQAAAFFSFLRTFGQALGVAISGSIFQNAFKARLLKTRNYHNLADEFSRDATIIVEIIRLMDDGPLRRELVDAYNGALHMIWVACIAAGGLCFLLSLTIKGYSLQQEHVTEQGLMVNGRTVGPTGRAEKGKNAVPREA
ncbi:hypothetical protein PspLS_01351 [Pyricularia sp. CBS 133598]|nr:hypothetical protein PspLS_01351 [Pyricularia sp. CBS 133598]